jgi:hypothetical protein
MIIQDERKIVTIDVTENEIEQINALDYVVVTENYSILDLETYANYVEVESPIVEETKKVLEDHQVEADLIQYKAVN